MGWIAGIFDFHPLSYYIHPVLFTVGIIFLLYLVSRQLEFAPFAALLISFSALHNPLFADVAGQFEPLIAMSFYALGGISFILYLLKRNLSYWFWAVPAFLFFLAYGSKVTAVYSCIAVVFFLCFFAHEKKPLFFMGKFHFNRNAIVFSSVFLLLFSVETLLLNHIFGLSAGRWEAITKIHLADPGGHLTAESFWEWLFSIFRFCVYSGNRKFLLILFMTGIFVNIFFFLKKKKCSCGLKFIFCLFLITYLFHCYAVTTVFPFRPVEPHLMRYQLLTLLYGHIICMGGLFCILKNTAGIMRKYALNMIVLLFLLLIMFGGVTVMRNMKKKHTVFSAVKIAFQSRKSIKEKIPVLLKYTSEITKSNVLISYYGPWEEIFCSENRVLRTCVDSNKNIYYILWNAPKEISDGTTGVNCYVFDSPESEFSRKEKLKLTEWEK